MGYFSGALILIENAKKCRRGARGKCDRPRDPDGALYRSHKVRGAGAGHWPGSFKNKMGGEGLLVAASQSRTAVAYSHLSNG